MNIRRASILTLLMLLTAATPGARSATPARQDDAAPRTATAVERDEQRRVRVRLARGGKVSLDNRTTGRIVVVGWDKDYVEAVATSERGAEYVRAGSEESASGQRVTLKADYLTEAWPTVPPLAPSPAPQTPAKPDPAPPAPTAGADDKKRPAPRAGEGFGPLFGLYSVRPEVHLEVKLPRYAEIELIEVNRSEVEVTGVSTPVAVSGKRSSIRLRDVGAAEVRTERGPVEVEGAAGLVDVVTDSGAIRIKNVRGDVRALSLSGSVEVRCVRGRVNVSTAEGSVVLAGVDGDVDATTVASDLMFDGAIREDGRYYLKSMSGAVGMGLRRPPPGFTALLSSYRGSVESDFKLASKRRPEGPPGTRLLGRHGDGRAQITLDSFDGKVRLSRLTPAPADECR